MTQSSHKIRTDEAKESFTCRVRLLEAFLTENADVSQELLIACKSQKKLAALDIPALNITPLSRSTIHKFSLSLLLNNAEGLTGLNYFNSLMNKTYEKYSNTINSQKLSPVARKKIEIDNLESKLKATESHSLGRSMAYLELIKSMAGLIAEAEGVIKIKLTRLLSEHETKYARLFHEVREPNSKGNVETLRK